MNLYEQRRKLNLAQVRRLRPYLKIEGFTTKGWNLCTTCKHCGAKTEKPISQWLKFDCKCKKAEKIGAAQLSSLKTIRSICATANLTLVGEYFGQNTKTLVRCTLCNHEYSAYLGNVRKGHGCQKCGTLKQKATVFSRYGVDSVAAIPTVQRKRKRTMLKRYGAEHALQNKHLYEKNVSTAYGWKKHLLGKRVVYVQGYEPQAIDWILGKNVKPTQILCGRGSDVPEIRYTFNGIRGLKYFPDIWVPHLNRLVEVKSDYTLVHSLQRNLAKRDAAIKAGYDFTFLVMDKNGNKLSNKRVEALISEARGKQETYRPTKGVRHSGKGRT